ncbi:MAG: DUF3987 domain-containing protein [Gammaproteobacteria bacterium]|nr:DUF3987 domain-containing protein [Gammaproteobacteria bacterium]
MSRQSNRNWIDEYISYTSNQESPEIFRRWVGFFILASAVRRCVWLEMDDYIIYPNLYIILIAESGCRKSSAHGPGIRLLYKIKKLNPKIKIFHEKMTTEGLLSEMQKGIYTPPGTSMIIPDGSVTIICDELANLFNKKSYSEDLISLLTSCYGGEARQDFLTKNKELVEVINPNICMLGATTPSQLGDIFKSSAITSGFFGRVIVATGQGEKRISFPTLNKNIESYLIDHLEIVSNMYGKIEMTDEARCEYDKWYSKLSFTPVEGMIEAFWQRVHNHIFKTAILISLAEGSEKKITLKQYKKAKKLVYEVGKGMESGLRYLNDSDFTKILEDICDIAKKTNEINYEPGTITRSGFTRKLYRRSKPEELDFYLDTLVQVGRLKLIKEDRTGEDGKKKKGIVYYKWVW